MGRSRIFWKANAGREFLENLAVLAYMAELVDT